MLGLTRRQIIMIAIGIIIIGAVVYGFLPTAIPVETSEVVRAPLRVTVEEEGETNVRERYVVSSPVAAYARRIEVEAGDIVDAGQALVALEAPRSPILDPTSLEQAQARVTAARAGVEQAEEQVRSAETVAERAGSARRRAERLASDASITQDALEQAISDARQAEAAAAAARAARATARAELAAAQAAIERSADGTSVQTVLTAPAAGKVLAVHRRSAGHVNPGEPILEIGDTRRLEVHADVQSQDAVRIHPGTRIEVDQWGGDGVLEGVVKRVEPEASVHVSSLGVEERRVAIISELLSPGNVWESLGSNYRVLARFVIWEDADVLQVETSALFRMGDQWGVFVVEDGRATRRPVSVGHQSGLRSQILSGLSEGEVVIIHPANEIEDGVAVKTRD